MILPCEGQWYGGECRAAGAARSPGKPIQVQLWSFGGASADLRRTGRIGRVYRVSEHVDAWLARCERKVLRLLVLRMGLLFV